MVDFDLKLLLLLTFLVAHYQYKLLQQINQRDLHLSFTFAGSIEINIVC